MTNRMARHMVCVVAWATLVVTTFAQSGRGLAGHWEGSIAAPGGDIGIEVDLAAGPASTWEEDPS